MKKTELKSYLRRFIEGVAVFLIAFAAVALVYVLTDHGKRIGKLEGTPVVEAPPQIGPPQIGPPGQGPTHPFKPPPFDPAAFFDVVRAELFGGSLTQAQVDGHKVVALSCALAKLSPLATQCAYVFATVKHETADTMESIEEWYGSTQRYAPWWGRGLVMLTWEENYKFQQDKLEKHSERLNKLGIPYKVHDDWNLALVTSTSAIITTWGMKDGDFTGLGLSDFITEGQTDYVGARKIVNGTDKADLIAGYAIVYEKALRAGYTGDEKK